VSAKPKTCAHCNGDLTGASIHTIQGIDVCADIRRCLAQQAEREQQPAEATGGEVKCGRECSEMHTYVPGECEAAVTAEGPQEETTGGEQVQDGAFDEARALLASSSKRTRFGRVFVEHLLAEHDALRKQLTAATARAESATVLPERWRALIAERDAAVASAEANAVVHDRWKAMRIERDAAVKRAQEAETYARSLTSALQAAADFSDAMKRIREMAAPDLGGVAAANAAFAAAVSSRITAVVPDAAQEARSATETAEDASGGAFQVNASASASAGLSKADVPADCDEPNIDGVCRHLTCGRCKQHTGDSHQGHYWAWCKVTKTTREFHFCCPGDCELEHDDTTEDDRG
jgi:hypothetical protein